MSNGIPPVNSWTSVAPCASSSADGLVSVIDNLTVSGSPGAITSMANDQSIWSLVLNDGASTLNFRLDRYVGGTFVDSPIIVSNATGTVTFNDPVMLAADPTQPLGAATKEYVDGKFAAGPFLPVSGGTLTGALTLAADPTANLQAATKEYVDNKVTASVTGVASFNTRTGAVTLTYGDVSAVLPASLLTPLMDGTAAIGGAVSWARADHVHPSDTSKLSLTGGTLTGALSGTTGGFSSAVSAGYLYVSNTAGTFRTFQLQTNSSPRWSLNADGTAESGSSAGSNLALIRYNDSGTAIDYPMSAVRSTGVVSFSQPIVNGSDRSLKERIAPITDALKKVQALTGVSFHQIGSDRRDIGLIAQDVKPHVPEVVFETLHYGAKGDETKLGIAYPQLTALLIEAMKTLAARVEALESK